MSLLIGNKKRFIVTILVLCTVFMLTMIWSVYAYIALNNKEYTKNQSYIIAEQYKLLYENDRRAINSIEPLLDTTMERVLKDVSQDIKYHPNIDIEYLKRLTKEYGITGIWLIEEQKIIHLSSEGIKNTDVTQWYKDRPDIEWDLKIDWLLNNEGSVWIDTFSKRNTFPYTYLKWGYMGLGEVGQLGGKVILEIGLNIDDAIGISELKGTIMKNELISHNIVSSQIILTDPQEPNQEIIEYQKRSDNNKNIIITSVRAKDFNNTDTQIIVSTNFPEIQNETRGAFFLSLGSSVFTIICMILIMVVLRKPKYSH